jgi:aminopeptidase S
VTSVRSPLVSLGGSASSGWKLDFSYTFAHNAKSSSADYLRVAVGGDVVFSQQGTASNRNAVWTHVSVNLDAYAGQNVRIVIEAADG